MEFSKDIVDLLKTEWPGKDIYSMSLQELKKFREEVEDKRHEYFMIEMAFKTLGNAPYGACANRFFYFYNVSLAGDITGECRNLTKTMWHNLENWFHNEIWERKDLWKEFDFTLDESKHDWYRTQPISVYSDTDSVYVTYGTFFKCMTPEYQEKYKEPRAKLDWILRYNSEFQDNLNNKWCHEIYDNRHGKSTHVFELETISYSCIYLKKKKYLKGMAFSKGKFFDEPKISGTGIEIIKSTTPKLCRKILEDLMQSLMFDYHPENKVQYMLEFNQRLNEYRKEFYTADIEDISQSVGIGDYKKYVAEDKKDLMLEKRCPVSVHAIARYNYLTHQNGRDDLCTYSGKIKYYNISVGNSVGYFGYPAGELPEWAPQMNKMVQWEKTIINPINRFLEVMDIMKVNAGGVQQLSLF